MARHRAAPADEPRPRTTVRTVTIAALGLLPLLPDIARVANVDTVPAVAAVLAVVIAVNRVLELPAVDAWLDRHLPALSTSTTPRSRPDEPDQ